MSEIRLVKVRIAFPALDKPEAFGEGEPAYQGKLIIAPKSENSKAILAALKAAAKEQWKDKADSVYDMLKEDKKLCYTETTYRSKKTGEPYAGFDGMHALSTRNRKQPTIWDKFGKQVLDPRDIKAMIYSGCYIHAKINIWAQDNKWGRRLNATLLGAMFAMDGEAFSGASPATAEDFKDLAVSEEDAMEDEGSLV
jgi:hypothetical protein